MPVLTFARYILEMSLMDYSVNVETSESQLATATMALALTIMKLDGWQTTLEYYSGYTLGQVSHLIDRLHRMLQAPPHESRNTIRTKYSHRYGNRHQSVKYLTRMLIVPYLLQRFPQSGPDQDP